MESMMNEEETKRATTTDPSSLFGSSRNLNENMDNGDSSVVEGDEVINR